MPQRRKTLSKEQIEGLFQDASDQGDYVIGYFRLLFGDEWDSIERLDDFPHAGEELASFLMKKAMAWDREHLNTNQVMAGGAMMNYGPSTDKSLDPWEATLPAAIYKEEDK